MPLWPFILTIKIKAKEVSLPSEHPPVKGALLCPTKIGHIFLRLIPLLFFYRSHCQTRDNVSRHETIEYDNRNK